VQSTCHAANSQALNAKCQRVLVLTLCMVNFVALSITMLSCSLSVFRISAAQWDDIIRVSGCYVGRYLTLPVSYIHIIWLSYIF